MRRMLLVLVLLLGACGSGGGKPAAPQFKIRVELTQGRVDEVRHTVQISMHNDGPDKLVVERVELRSPSFSGAEPVTADAWLPVGGLQVDVPVSYGKGVCAGDDLQPHAAPSFVALRVHTDNGPATDVRLPVANPNA